MKVFTLCFLKQNPRAESRRTIITPKPENVPMTATSVFGPEMYILASDAYLNRR